MYFPTQINYAKKRKKLEMKASSTVTQNAAPNVKTQDMQKKFKQVARTTPELICVTTIT